MEKKLSHIGFEDLVQQRKSQLKTFKNVPNHLEIVLENENKVVLNNATSTDLESALEAVSAIEGRVIWITQIGHSSINFLKILNQQQLVFHPLCS